MAKVIIAIHGLRNKPPKEMLKGMAMKSINEGIEKLDIDIKLPKIELVYWADILFDKPLSPDVKDKKSPYYIDEYYTPEPENYKIETHNIKEKSISVLKKAVYKTFLTKDYKLRYPAFSRNFLHKNFHEMEVYFSENCAETRSLNCALKKKINDRMIEALQKHKNDEILLIAHSMGSIIAFDVLSFIAKEAKVHTFVTIGSPLGAPFVVSRIAKAYKKTHQGHIKLQTPEAVKKHWFNFSDINDNIALDHKLADEFKPNSTGVKVIDQLVHNTYHMNGIANPHKSFGYLRTPEVIQTIAHFLED